MRFRDLAAAGGKIVGEGRLGFLAGREIRHQGNGFLQAVLDRPVGQDRR